MNSRYALADIKLATAKSVIFCINGSEEIAKNSVVSVDNCDLFDKGIPKPNGLYDLRMGTIDKGHTCQTCNGDIINCQGHFGHIKLAHPVFNICFIKIVHKIVQCICMRCSEILIECPTNIHNITSTNRLRVCMDRIKKHMKCIHCEFVQPRWGLENNLFNCTFDKGDASSTIVDSKMVLNILRKISETTCATLGMDFVNSHPKNMIIEVLAVPPPVVRPSITMDSSARTQDDLTHKLIEIIKCNQHLEKQLAMPVQQKHVIDEYINLVQFHVNTYIDNEIPGQPQATQRNGRPIKSIGQRIRTKEGRVRGNLMGKRVDFSARTVITADPNIRLDELGVPVSIACNMTFEEIVTPYNITLLQKCVDIGPKPKNPLSETGAKYVVRDGMQRDLRFTPSFELEIGDVVHRMLMNGDYVVFNRQPTLHKMSMMGHRVKIMNHNTFRMNLSVTTPYNADFDGDEMNMHIPCGHAGRAEVKELMMVSKCIVSAQSNKPVMGIVQDALLACRKMTTRDVFIDKETVMQILMKLTSMPGSLPVPAILKPIPLWSGKQLASMVIPSGIIGDIHQFASWHEDNDTPSFSEGDTEVLIDGLGDLITGTLCKGTVGASSNGIIHKVWLHGGPERACDLISDLQMLANAWLFETGFSVGISDCINPNVSQTVDIVNECVKEVGDINRSCVDNKVNPANHEQNINNILNKARDSSGTYVQNNLKSDNSLYQMVSGGSKGSIINIAQIMACVGQQNINGGRIKNGYIDRTLPHFKRFDNNPEGRGFVKHSYIQGLNPTEFYFHAMGGREGVIDTAIKTSETGYIQRRLVKAMEDMKIGFDGLLKNSIGDIVQFAYGDDGYDGCMLNSQILPPHLDWITKYTRTNKIHLPVDCREVFEAVDKRQTKQQISEITTREEIVDLAESNHLLRWILGAYLDEYRHFSNDQLYRLKRCLDRQIQSGKVQPGEMVGTIAAQSLGQPITQMTLNTFHAAGISAKNVTLGVPRLKELINLTKSLKSPSMTIKLKPGYETTTEAEFENCLFEQLYVSFEIHQNLELSRAEQEYIDLMDDDILRESITDTTRAVKYELDHRALILKNITITYLSHVLNMTSDACWWFVYYENDTLFAVMRLFSNNGGLDDNDKIKLQAMKTVGFTVRGYKSIPKCFKHDINPDEFETIGSDLENIVINERVDPYGTTTNNVIETLSVLGVEAARQTLLDELQLVIEFDGSYVNYRHLNLLVDTMTYKGQLMPITRHGMNRTEAGVLMRCSFEETVNIIIDAASHAETDPIKGVTENIIMGQLPKVGTGCIDILLDFEKMIRLSEDLENQQTDSDSDPCNSEPLPVPGYSEAYEPPSPRKWNDARLSSFFPPKEFIDSSS